MKPIFYCHSFLFRSLFPRAGYFLRPLAASLLLLLSADPSHAQIRIPKIPKSVGGGDKSADPGALLGGGGKVKAELDQAERALDGCDRHLKKESPDGCQTYHAKFEDSLQDAQKALQGASLGAAANFATRINELKARRDQQVQAMQTSGAATANANQVYSAEDAEKDKAAIEAMENFYRRFIGLTNVPTDERLAVLADWPRVQAESQRLLAKYPMVKSRQNMPTETHAMIVKVRDLDAKQKQAVAQADMAMDKMPAALRLELKQAQESVEAAEQRGLTARGLSVEKFLANIDQLFKVYEIIGKNHAKFDATLEPSIRAEAKPFAAWLDKFTEKLIAENEVPADDYSGPDAAGLKQTVRQLWAKNFPNVKILRVGFTGDWFRSEGWKWEDNRSAWFKFDRSKLNGYAIIDTGHPKHLYIQSVNAWKDHQNGGQLDVRIGIWDANAKPHPGGTVLRSKLK